MSYFQIDGIKGIQQMSCFGVDRECLFTAIVVIISFLILPISGVDVHNNTAIYLHHADKMLEGKQTGMVFPEFDTTRGPLYPAILAAGFKLLGKTVHSASLVTRLFFSLGIILTYLVGRILYGRAAGILASVLVATSHGMNSIAEFIDTDIVLPVFILLFILFYYLSLEKSNRCFTIMAGVSLGLALMVKESAVLVLGVLLGMSLVAQRGKKADRIKSGLWVAGAAVITLVPWMLVTFNTYGSLSPMLGVAHPDLLQNSAETEGFNSSLSYWAHLFTIGLKRALYLFYRGFLCEISVLAPLMVVSWIVLSIRGFWFKKNNNLIVSFSVICFLPLILYSADTNIRHGQTTVIYMILYICLAHFVISGIPFLVEYAGNIGRNYRRLAILGHVAGDPAKGADRMVIFTGILLVCLQLFGNTNSTWRKWTRGQNSLAVLSWKAFDTHGRFTNDQQEAAEWIKENVPKNPKIIADGYTNEALDFFDVAGYDIPVFSPQKSMSIALDIAEKRTDNTRPLFLFTYSGFESGAQRHRIVFPIFEEDIVNAIRGECPDYIVISWRSLFYGEYFDKAIWADLSFANKTVRIYKIDLEKFEPVVFENIGVNDTIREHLNWLKKHYPDEYTLFEDKLNIFGLTVGELVDSPLMFPKGQIY